MQTTELSQIRSVISANRRFDLLFAVAGFLALMVGVLAFVALFAEMVGNGMERINPDFFMNFPSRRAGNAGILSAWVGSLLVMLVTAVSAIPLGIAAGVYLEEYAPKNIMTDLIEINVTNLAGVPSIVYGLLALGVFVYAFGFGQSILSAGLTLGLLILPVVIVSTREALRAIPVHIREGAYGVGATQWQVVSDHLVPYATPGIMTGVIIGMSRAIGETAPIITIGALTFIAFLPPAPISDVAPFISFEWLKSGFTVMPIQMFNWTSRPEEAFQQNAAAAGLILVLMTLMMNGVAIWLRYRLRKSISW